MGEKPLLEISRRSISITKTEEPSISWDNSFLTVRCQKGLNLLYFSRDLECMDKQIDWCITSIPSPKSSPATSLFTNKFKEQPMNNLEYEQMTLEPALWPHNPVLLKDLASIIHFEWSPPDFMYNYERALAVLTNVGNVELYGPKSCGFRRILEISSVIEDLFKRDSNSMPGCYDELKKAAEAVVTSAMCWGNKHNGTYNFVTAQKNGDVYFWKLKYESDKVSIDLVTKFKAEYEGVVAMRWLSLSKDQFIIIHANDCGQLFMHKYEWTSNSIQLINLGCLWQHKDKFVIKLVKFFQENDNITILCGKDRHVVALLVDDNCEKKSEYVYNVNDYKITSISLYERNKDFYITTINCKVYKVAVIISGGNIEFSVAPILLKDSYANKELYGFQLSKNNMISAVAFIDRKIKHRKENALVDIVFFCQDADHKEEITCLLTNPSKKLTDYGDCIEMLRYKTMKLKVLPSIPQLILLYATDSNNPKNLYEIKVYYILLKFYNSLENILKNGSKGLLPETSIEVVREKILVLHASNTVTNLLKKSQNGLHLTSFETEALMGTKQYLNYYCKKYNVAQSDLFPSEVADLTDVGCKYNCQCCEQQINGFSCADGHLNMFCALTFTPIETDQYLVCNGCGVVARIELLSEKPICVFCDNYLNYYALPL